MKPLHVNDVTPEALFEARRHFLKLGAGALVSSSALSQLMASLPKDLSLTYTPDTNPLKLTLNRPPLHKGTKCDMRFKSSLNSARLNLLNPYK